MDIKSLRLKIDSQSADHIKPYSIPIWDRRSDNNPILDLCGTGVLLKIADQHFLLTAAHVADRSGVEGKGLYLLGRGGGPRVIPLTGTGYASSGSEDERHMDDPYDIAVAPLPLSIVQNLSEEYRFLNLTDLDPTDAIASGKSIYMVVGYPTEWYLEGPFKALAYEAFGYRGKSNAVYNVDARRDIILTFQRDGNQDQNGVGGTLPEPHGMSGGGVWRLVEAGTNGERWSVENVRLTGILHSWDIRLQVLRATRIEFVLSLIKSNFPELRNSVDLHVGTTWSRTGWKPSQIRWHKL